MLPRARAKAAAVLLVALAVPASCTQILGLGGDYTLGAGGSASGGDGAGGTNPVGSGGGGGEVPVQCLDETQNGDETAVDCGGSRCPRCAINLACEVGSDCLSGLCTGKQCACPDGAVADASGTCVCAAVGVLCAEGCQPAPSASFVFDETDGSDEVVAPSLSALPDGAFGMSWVRSFSGEVLIGQLTANDTVLGTLTDELQDYSSSSLTPASNGTSFRLSTIKYANTPPGWIRNYGVESSSLTTTNVDSATLYDSDRIDCAAVGGSEIRCVFFHVQPTNVPTVQSIRFSPGTTVSVDFNDTNLLNASEFAFPAIASDGTASLMAWLGTSANKIRFVIDDGNAVGGDDDLALGGLGQVGRVDVATHPDGFSIVTWVESPNGEPPFKLGIAAVDPGGFVVSQTAIPLEDEALEIIGPVSIAIGPTASEKTLGAISYTTRNNQTSSRELQVLYVDLSSPARLAAGPAHNFVTLAAPDRDGALESPALVFHPTRGIGLGFVHFKGTSEESVELYRMPACDLFVPE